MNKSISDIQEIECEFVLTIGNFDGVHKGHVSLIDQIKTLKSSNLIKLAAMTFHPHPHVVLFSKEDFLLERPDNKSKLLFDAGVDFIITLPFTRDFSTLSPTEFLTKYVFKNKLLKMVCLGHDFNFGSNKQGTFEDFAKLGESQNIQILKMQPFGSSNNQNISSSLIRRMLKEGNVKTANEYLGRNYSLDGGVVKGAGRGKLIGFPTANMNIDKTRLTPKIGVYATITQYKGIRFQSITNIGRNPTFGEGSVSIETYIFDFNHDIYGENIELEFCDFIRDEIKFANVNDLISQISKDVELRKSLNV
ncbi:MAG: riboflavin biosynthesis protein RibF [Bdellovibrio sp. CG12_big_fil_rev_8_21_14_0_65_39_13]|nr:MAG: riboflavin biosynthesis protein RibF [Bdellovibrio sp. CG22_combo_CG10-13_8_21_14_all_39_27]PIQ60841.1 MAG: riboflavin biosynthesis protein RibF [Bdellovibrio sp. CG12_big_fil_rev_8_21_14_0_65_39_13]PIR36464.1 MAG: riboflavin biosynthesis protein RibF [Bdellovibrio sp. CG11_big_fil_rev_8_21_14_0_20_39_38]